MNDKIMPAEVCVYTTNKNFLNVYDYIKIGKLKLELAAYDPESHKQTAIATAWLEVDDFKLLSQLINSRGFKDVLIAPTTRPGRFERFGGSNKDGQVESRTFLLEYDDPQGKFASYPFRLTITNGPGKADAKGAIKPIGEPSSRVQMRIPESDLMKIMLTSVDYVRAYEVNNWQDIMAEKRSQLQKKLDNRNH